MFRRARAAARDYMRFVSEFVGVPVALIGVGPSRDQVIWTQAATGMSGYQAAA